ncbi:hypothetical protein SCP_1000410 [Sparassis crispa]|uniref:Fe2OG dioxygenase domain-containing protein n=1 Tax=Sparassis crispa TaxID=139825 RepID=A0A401GXB1_9APHY|nr:hypothetical protein SCP_1000410 [Sparassis crispa]GBE86799.1 hypothetical protein SCP_1000410 [Sparassis crispa]
MDDEDESCLLMRTLLKELAAIYEDDEHWSVPTKEQITRMVHPDATGQGQLTERLKKWFENGAVSGFGDAQETKVHANVRDAREIPASEFSVSPNLIEQVEKCWGDHVVSGSVRVEPYEIHVYGPGGQLKAHRDTSETNLVGTFLVGLGDTTKKGRLFIGEQIYNPVEYDGHKAIPGSWIALHPNVKHKVAKIQDGYRAVIAFKFFCKEKDGMRTSVVRKKMENIL